jgi:hypothetical protein
MYKIEKTYYGFYITFSGIMNDAEAAQFKAEVEGILPSLRKSWSSVIDLQNWIPAEPKIQKLLSQVERLSKNHGLQRRAIILRSPVINAQVTRLSFKSKTNEIERRINASKVENWKEQAIAWAVHGAEPTAPSAAISSPN